MLKKILSYTLEITVFICGAVVMIFELIGSRILGPFFGTSIFVWTGLIGIILGSLSLGYYFGGKLADKQPNLNILSIIIFFASITIGITMLIKSVLLNFFLNSFFDIQTGSIFASILLFFPASFLLGMVSPYAAKIKLDSLDTSGSTVGNLYALSTFGSIAGTFAAGYYLIPRFGTNKLLIILSVTLILLSLLLQIKKFTKIKIIAVVMFISIWPAFNMLNMLAEKNGFIDVDTAYNRIWIYDYLDSRSNKFVKKMGINDENHSSMFLDSNDLVSEYSKYFHLAINFNPNLKKALLFGGAGYSYPKDFLLKYPGRTIDVVEIDPQVTELAKKYFRLKDDPRLTIYHDDGRVFLNKTEKKYDVIFGDAFGSRYSLPYQLTTKEAIQKKYDILNEDGVVLINLISSIEGESGQFLRAEYATYRSIFPQVYLFPVTDKNDGEKVQNIVLAALKSTKNQTFTDPDKNLNECLGHLWKKTVDMDTPILTDDYAPIDYYIGKII
jgi:spermidine synthase